MTADRVRLVRAGLLFGLALLIAKLFAAGEMSRYMAPALDPLTALTGGLLAAMGVVELRGAARGGERREDDGHGHGGDPLERALTYGLILLPLGLGLLVAPRALGASALGGENVATMLLAFNPGAATPGTAAPPPARPLDDVPGLVAYLQQAGLAGVGQRVRVTGLLVRSDGLAGNEVALLRYTIVHCVADARPLVVLVAAGEGAEVPGDQWAEIEGVLAVREREGSRLVTIEASRITPVAEPANPYLTPSF